MSDPRRALIQQLADWRSAGVSHVPHVEVLHRLEPARQARAVSSRVASAGLPEETPPPPASTLLPSPSSTVPSSTVSSGSAASTVSPPARELSVSCGDLPRPERVRQLEALARTVSQCTRCQELAQTRTQTVFGVGHPQARVMFIGEAPGADEDARGEPFVGKAGQLLNRIIAACGWKREDLYICNILRCRPPGNRTPTPQEAANCREYLDGQIRIVDPEYIVCWGSVAAVNLLGDSTPIGRLRQKWFRYGRAKVLCTYHPSYLLRNPSAKKPVWEDMKFLLADMGLEPPAS